MLLSKSETPTLVFWKADGRQMSAVQKMSEEFSLRRRRRRFLPFLFPPLSAVAAATSEKRRLTAHYTASLALNLAHPRMERMILDFQPKELDRSLMAQALLMSKFA